MTELHPEPSAAAAGEWVAVERSTTTRAEGVIETVVLASSAPFPVVVRLREDLPASWAVRGVAIHPDHEPSEFTADARHIEFGAALEPGERRQVVYGVHLDDVEDLDPPAALRVLGEHRLNGDATADDEAPEARVANDAEDPVGTTGADEPATGDDSEDRPRLFPAPPDDNEPTEGPFQLEYAEDGPGPLDGSGGPDDDPEEPRADPTEEPVGGDLDHGLEDPPAEPVDEPGGVELDDDWDDPPADPTDESRGTDLDDGRDEDATSSVDEPPSRDPPDDAGPARSTEEAAVPGPVAGDGGLLEVPDGVLDDAQNLLVLADDAHRHTGCTRLLERELTAEDGLVLVSFLDTVDERIEALGGLVADPASIDLVCMGDGARSAAAETTDVETPVGPVAVTGVADPADLLRLGVHASRAMEEASGEPVLCFHTMTALVGLVGLHRAFRFLHVLTARVRAEDARAHYHLDPAVVDEHTVSTLTPLFDAVVRFEDGHWTTE
jgi:hypothetical protein